MLNYESSRACDPKTAALSQKQKWKVQLMCVYKIITKTLDNQLCLKV